MKNPLKVLLLAAVLFGCTNYADAQLNIGVKAGFNLATLYDDFEDPQEEAGYKWQPTFQVGAVLDLGLTDHFVIQPGLMLVGKGAKIDESGEVLGTSYSVKGHTNLWYVQVPVNLMYRSEMFYAGVGPYIGFGVAGKSKLKSTSGGQVVFDDEDDVAFGNGEEDDVAPLDYGANVEAGVILGSLRLGAGYALGLANIIPSDQRGDDKVTHGVISVNATYMFGGEE